MLFVVSTYRLHYAVHGRTAAKLIVERADAEQEHMGLTTWENAPDGKIVKTDVSIAKNYLKEMELADMGQLVMNYLLKVNEKGKVKRLEKRGRHLVGSFFFRTFALYY